MDRLQGGTFPKLYPNFFEQIKAVVYWRSLGEIFQKIIENSTEINLLSLTNPNKPNSNKTLHDKIIKKTTQLQSSYRYCGIRVEFNKLVQSIPTPLSIRSRFFFRPSSQTNLTCNNDDIQPYQLINLKNCLTIKRSKQKYEQLIKNWDTSLPLPVELSQWKPEEFKHLFIDSSYDSGTPLVNELNNITDRLLKNEPGVEKEGRLLLERALKANCPNVVSYLLLLLEIDFHSPIHKGADLFSLAMSITPTNETALTAKITTLKALYAARNPLSTTSFYAIIFHALQSYLPPTTPENQKKNHLLFDAIISSLLNATMSVEDQIKDRSKYIGHLFGLKEKEAEDANVTKALQGDDLEGHFPEKYIWVHLRLFFQKIIETIQLSKKNIDERVINEFLCELETGWIINQSRKWFQMNGKLEHRKAFIHEVLVDYTLRQICKLPPDAEYVVCSGLPAHTIYVAFKKHKNNRLEIRVDNLGGFSEEKERHVATISLISEQINLRTYLACLFETTAQCYDKEFSDDEGEKFAEKIYSPKQFRSPIIRNTYPNFPLQETGNCTHYSFLLGQCIRLNDQNGDFFLSLPSIMERIALIDKLANEGQNSIAEAAPIPYKAWCRQKLLNQYLTLKGNDSTIPFMRCETLRDERILRAFRSPLPGKGHILIEGAAGIGKTIFSEQLAHQLQSSEELGSVVFYLPLRRLLKSPKNISAELIDLVELYILDRKLPFHEKELMKTLTNDPSAIWILDGFDELVIQEHLKEALKELFQRKQLIVTSRPHFSTKKLEGIVDIKKFECFQMGSYTLEQEKALVDFHFSSNENQDQEKLKADLKSIIERNSVINPHLKRMCEIPLSLSNVCKLLIAGHTHILMETNIAVITEMFVSSLVINAYRRKKENSLKSLPEIMEKYAEPLESMKKLGFISLEEARKTHFSLEVKNQVLPSGIDHKFIERDLEEIGLLQLDQDGGQFVHATYQEYFTALYLVKGMKYRDTTVKYQKIRKFIENHRNSSEYDQVFLYVVQIFKAKILHSVEGKRNEHFSMLMVFLHIYFSKIEENSERSDSSLEQPLIALISTIYEIAEEVPNAEDYKTFITKQINPFVKWMLTNTSFESYRSSANELQKFISSHPHLKDDLELPLLIAQIFTESAPQKTGWILDFINTFEISMVLPFLFKLSSSTTPQQAPKMLTALRAALPEKAHLEQPAVDEINRLIRIVLVSGPISHHFPLVVSIYEKMREQVNLSGLFCETIKTLISQDFIYQWQLISFIEFIKTEKPYDFINNDFIDNIVKSNLQPIISNFSHFLISYLSKLIEMNNTDQLKKMPDWFSRLFRVYEPSNRGYLCWSSSHERSPTYEMLKSLKQTLVVKQDRMQTSHVNLIFELWDQIVVQKDLKKIIESECLDYIRTALKQLPSINRFSFCSGAELRARVLGLANGSTQTAKKDNRYRTDHWASIGAFFADKNVIDMMDQESPWFVDDILNVLLHLSNMRTHGNSGLQGEIDCAITNYTREIASQTLHDKRRIQLIRNTYYTYTGIPEAQVEPVAFQIPTAIETPNKPLGFHFDFSYYGYSDTLVQLKHLVSQNPNWIQQFMTFEEKEKLKELENDLIIEVKTIANIDNDPILLEEKRRELAIVQDLLQKGNGAKK